MRTLLVPSIAAVVALAAAPPDLQRRCESLAAASRIAAPRPVMLASRVERTIELPGSPRLLGAQWLSATNQLAIFDVAESKVIVLDSLGQAAQSLGRAGAGPAEFKLEPMQFGSRQKFRIAPDGRVAVLDSRFVHLFQGREQVQEAHFEVPPPGISSDAHVARVRDGWIVSLGDRFSSDADARSRVTLYRIADGRAPRTTLAPVGTVRNVNVTTPNGAEGVADLPYSSVYRRTWDANGASMAIASYQRFAVCVGVPDDSTSWRAWTVAAQPRRVDAAERTRVLTERFGRATGVAPMMNVRVEDYFGDRWPAVAPYYHDLTALDESSYAAVRLDASGGVTADFIDVRQGYRGSVSVPTGHGLIGGYANGLLLLNPVEGTIVMLRVALPSGAVPAAR